MRPWEKAKLFAQSQRASARALSKGATSGQEAAWLIVGLGNPGDDYRGTWHNAGFMALEHFVSKEGLTLKKLRYEGRFGSGKIAGQTVHVLEPLTYMNASGRSVAACVRHLKLRPERVIILYDDLDLELGRLRLLGSGGSGTHNGMRDIVKALGSEQFGRLRIGIGPKPEHLDLVDFVLQRVPSSRQDILKDSLERVAVSLHLMIEEGLEAAMNETNRRLA